MKRTKPVDKWKLRQEKERQGMLAEVRRHYGQDKVQPNEQQRRTLLRYWQTNQLGKLNDYCRKHGLDPNKCIQSFEGN